MIPLDAAYAAQHLIAAYVAAYVALWREDMSSDVAVAAITTMGTVIGALIAAVVASNNAKAKRIEARSEAIEAKSEAIEAKVGQVDGGYGDIATMLSVVLESVHSNTAAQSRSSRLLRDLRDRMGHLEERGDARDRALEVISNRLTPIEHRLYRLENPEPPPPGLG